MRKTYDVDGMTCGGCANTLRNALTAEIPAASVDVDLAGAKVSVEPADDAAVQRAVEAAGFTYRGVVEA
ncbi:MAG: heavy metal transporter [Rhodospirillaceae bacterium BRH_c57]|nr:MAG: heavy metal transporter [Rhodospirillaceae bacterium BRH_c57]